MEKITNTNNPLMVLIGEQLSSVIFVQDYLQLDFDGNRLTCYVWPVIALDDIEYRFNDTEYRNKLCNLIAKLVKYVILEDGISLRIVFTDNSAIFLPLDYNRPIIRDDPSIKEIAIFEDSNGNWSFF
jgi:hypothetical protein